MDYDELIARQRKQLMTSLPPVMERLGWTAEELAAKRQGSLRELLAWAKERSPFYRERLAGINPAIFTEADLPSLPALTKDEMMANFDAIVTDPRLTLAMADEHIGRLTSDAYLLDTYRALATGGSTGRRGVFVYGWDEWITLAQQQVRWRLRSAGSVPSEPLIIASLLAEKASHLGRAISALLANPAQPPVSSFPITLPLAEVVAGLNATQPTALLGYPSALDVLTEEARGGRLSISPKRVVTAGEVLTEDTRDRVGQVWRVEVEDWWGATEGVHAIPCGAGRAMHWPDDMVIIEPVDEHGKPVPAGVPAAKILITNLYNLTQPLIRYEITDELTLLDEPCPCGCAHRRIANITGRQDDLFRYDGGIVVHPVVFRSPLGRDRTVIEYQVTQTPRGAAITVRSDGDGGLESLRQQIITDLTKAGLTDPEVTVTKVDSVARLPTGKLRRFIPLE